MEVPILKQGDILIASVQAALSDRDLLELQERIAKWVGNHRIKGVIIDVTVLDILDSFAVRVLRSLAEVVALRGAIAVIVGIQPEVAVAMVRLGLTLENVLTVLDLDDGLAALKSNKKSPGEAPWKPRKTRSTKTA